MTSFDALIAALEANDPAVRNVSFSAADIGSGRTVVDLWDLSRSHLDMRKNSMIGIDRLRRLARALEKNTALDFIDFSGLGLDDDEAEVLAEVLRTNTSLVAMDLSNNRIGDRGICALADALSRNTTMEFFFSNNNPFGDDGAKTMARALSMNTALRGVMLTGFSMGKDGVYALKKVIVDVNATLVQLDFLPEQLFYLTHTTFSETLYANRDLVYVFRVMPPLGDGSTAAGAFDALPNEMLCLIATFAWPTVSLISLAHTCRRWRDCALSELVAIKRTQAAIDADADADAADNVIPIRCDQHKIFRDAFFED